MAEEIEVGGVGQGGEVGLRFMWGRGVCRTCGFCGLCASLFLSIVSTVLLLGDTPMLLVSFSLFTCSLTVRAHVHFYVPVLVLVHPGGVNSPTRDTCKWV